MSGVVPSVRAFPSIPGVTRGLGRERAAAESTGLDSLDSALNGGWPLGAVSQMISSSTGLGFSLLLPLLAKMTQSGRQAGLVAPPYVPFAPALRDAGILLPKVFWIAPKDRIDALWATEQMLRSGLFGTVALWIPELPSPLVRRLQVAAEKGRSIAFLLHNEACAPDATAAVRLDVQPSAEGLRIEVERCRGAQPGSTVIVPFELAA